MTLNGIIALILLYFTEFYSFACRLRHSGSLWLKINLQCPQNIVFQLGLYLAKTDQRSSRWVSLRQLSFSFIVPVFTSAAYQQPSYHELLVRFTPT